MKSESIVENEIETDRTLIEAELQRLLKQKRFVAASQMSAFLQYIVIQTLDGNGDRIKAFTVGVDALGKPDTFDAQNDPSVRVLALRLRKCLKASYELDHGLEYARIVLKVGTYVPEFLKAERKLSLEQGALPLDGILVPETRIAPDDASSNVTHLQIKGPDKVAESTALFENSAQKAAGSATCESPEVTISCNTWMVSSLLLLLIAVAWTISGSRNDSFAVQGSTGDQEVQIASVSPHSHSGDSTSAMNDTEQVYEPVPRLFMPIDSSQSQHARQFVTLLGGAVVQQGAIDVIRIPQTGDDVRLSGSGYWMIIDEIQLDSGPNVIVQLLRKDSGAVLMSRSLTFDATSAGFSTDEIKLIEALASDLSNAEGPLFQHHCRNLSLRTDEQCLQSAVVQ